MKMGDFKASATAFIHRLNNWIMWVPDANGNWSANNARQVESRGVELSAEYGKAFYRHHAFKLFGRYQYVSSINTKVYQADETSLNKQLFYTPMHTGFTQLRYSFRKLQFNFGAVYTGSRYTTADNDPVYMLPGYMIFNSGLAYAFTYKKHSSSLLFTVNNLGNATYQVVQNRPMPLRNYQVTLKININYEKN